MKICRGELRFISLIERFSCHQRWLASRVSAKFHWWPTSIVSALGLPLADSGGSWLARCLHHSLVLWLYIYIYVCVCIYMYTHIICVCVYVYIYIAAGDRKASCIQISKVICGKQGDLVIATEQFLSNKFLTDKFLLAMCWCYRQFATSKVTELQIYCLLLSIPVYHQWMLMQWMGCLRYWEHKELLLQMVLLVRVSVKWEVT